MASGLNLMSELSCDTCCFFEPENDFIGRVFGECRLKAPPFPTILDSSNMWCGEHSEITSEYEGETFVRMPTALVRQLAFVRHTSEIPLSALTTACNLAIAKENAKPQGTAVQARRKLFWNRNKMK